MNFFRKPNFSKIFLFLFLLAIPFGTKKFVFSFLPEISEYNSFFLYASDIFLIVFALFTFWQIKQRVGALNFSSSHFWLVIFLGFGLVSVFLATYQTLAFYYFIRLFVLLSAAAVLAFAFDRKIFSLDFVATILGGGAIFQALLALAQFKLQRSIGLQFLGESPIDIFTKGVARVSIAGGTILRAYGTMPHANILAAFLILGLISLCYLYIQKQSFGGRLVVAMGMLFVVFGLVFTFSRSGWIAAIISEALFIILSLRDKNIYQAVLNLTKIIIVCFLLVIIAMSWAIFPRAKFFKDEESVRLRWIYNLLAFDIIREKPAGVGIGNQVLYAADHGLYAKYGLWKERFWQPVHNLYLLMASEIGALGLVSFLAALASAVLAVLRFRKSHYLGGSYSLAMLGALLVFGFFDHFLWDLQAGRLMLWLTIGIVLGQQKENF